MQHSQWNTCSAGFFDAIIFMSVTVSPRAKQVSCQDFKLVKRVFVIWTNNPEFWYFVYEDKPPSVEPGLLNSQRVSVKFCHDSTPTRAA
jgi:hypothetical protein